MEQVKLEYIDHIAVVTIDAPPLNALSKTVLDNLESAFNAIEARDDLAVVLTGAGEKAFVAGADISQFKGLDDVSGANFVRRGQALYQKISEFPIPVICAINGYALGGGCELALACDIRVAAENAKIGLPEATLGILPGYGGTQRLPRLVGAGMAKKLIFSGEPIRADEAYGIGLVEILTPAGEALDEALALARRIHTACAPLAIREIKKAINEGGELSLPEAIELEAQAFGRLCLTADKDEGVAAFFEKRKADFQGK